MNKVTPFSMWRIRNSYTKTLPVKVQMDMTILAIQRHTRACPVHPPPKKQEGPPRKCLSCDQVAWEGLVISHDKKEAENIYEVLHKYLFCLSSEEVFEEIAYEQE